MPSRTFLAGRVALVLLAAAPLSSFSQPAADTAPVGEMVRALQTADPTVQAARFGVLNRLVDKAWLHAGVGDLFTLWRTAQWVVPGAALRYQRGMCVAGKCQVTSYVVQFNAKTRELEGYEGDSLTFTGRQEADGSMRLGGASLIGMATTETLRFEEAGGLLHSNQHPMRLASAQELAAASHGQGGWTAATAAASSRATPAPPAAGSAPAKGGNQADLRAELEAMKARVEQLTRQVEQRSATQAPAAPAAPDPAAARAEQQRLAQERAAEARRLAEERKAQEEEQKRVRAEEARLAAETAKAKALEDQRLRAEQAALAMERADAESLAEAPSAARRLRLAALREKFPALVPGEVRMGQLKPNPRPELVVLQLEKGGTYKVEAVADGFTPHVAIFDAVTREPVARATGKEGELLQLRAALDAASAYVVVVQSADGKPGRYGLQVSN